MTNYTVKELEEKIMDGFPVTPAEFAEALRVAEAADRIAELTKKGEQARAEAFVRELEALKQQAKSASRNTGSDGLALAYKISEMERKLNDTNK
jgi:regulator of protease activity HflC (stomatin/prohibitin superfamily)